MDCTSSSATQEGIRVLDRSAASTPSGCKDLRLEAQVRERLAECLSDRGDLPQAVAEYERASQLYGPTASGEAARLNAERLRARDRNESQH